MSPAGPEPPNDSREPGPHVSLRCELRIKNTTGTGQIGTYCIKLHIVGGEIPNFIFSLDINNGFDANWFVTKLYILNSKRNAMGVSG